MIELLEDVVDRALGKFPNKYELVRIASKRANQLTNGYTPLIESKFVKPASIALLEVAEGKIRMGSDEE